MKAPYYPLKYSPEGLGLRGQGLKMMAWRVKFKNYTLATRTCQTRSVWSGGENTCRQGSLPSVLHYVVTCLWSKASGMLDKLEKGISNK